MKKINRAFLLISLLLLAAGSTEAAPLYFPHVDTTPPWQTEIAVINTSAVQGVTGTLLALSNQGQLVESRAVAIPALGRRQVSVADEFGNDTGIGYIVFETDADTVEGYTKFFIDGSYRAAIPAVKQLNVSDIHVTHIDSGTQWWTGLSLVNTTAEVKNTTIAFNTGETRALTLNANEHRAFTVAQLFNGQPRPDIRSAVIRNAGGVVGLELFGTHDGNRLEGILLTDQTASTRYYPHVDSNGWWTGIVASNPSPLESTITITPYTAEGTPLPTITDSLAGGGKTVGTVEQLGLPAGTAWFKIVSTQPLAGFELFGTLDDRRLAAYAGDGRGGAKAGVFAKIEKNGWTGIAFVNTEINAATVTLTAYTDGGMAVATRVLVLGGNAKVVNLAEALFIQQDISSATYIAFSADRNVVGFQLNGSADDAMLDGLPALGGPPRVAVSAVSPVNGATGVPRTNAVSVTFNRTMDPATINAATFQVTVGGTPVAGTISAAGTTYTFTPAGNLAGGALYTVTVTTGAMDAAGHALAEPFTSTVATAGGAATVAVAIGDFFFAPASVTVNAGDTVVWTNTGFALHATTSGATPVADGVWGGPFLGNGQSFSFTFASAGVFPYFCAVHPFMTGTVTVQ